MNVRATYPYTVQRDQGGKRQVCPVDMHIRPRKVYRAIGYIEATRTKAKHAALHWQAYVYTDTRRVNRGVRQVGAGIATWTDAAALVWEEAEYKQ